MSKLVNETNKRKGKILKTMLFNDKYELAPLFVFPKIIKIIHKFLNIETCFHLPSIIITEKCKKYLTIKNKIDNNILIKWIPIIQNLQSYNNIQSYLNYYPIKYGYPFIYNPLTCAVCPKLLNVRKSKNINNNNILYCSYKCFSSYDNKSIYNSIKILGKKRYKFQNLLFESKNYKQLISSYYFGYTNKQLYNIKHNISKL